MLQINNPIGYGWNFLKFSLVKIVAITYLRALIFIYWVLRMANNTVLPSVGWQQMIICVFNLRSITLTSSIWLSYFFKFIHSWWHFNSFSLSSDMIVPRSFRRQFFTNSVTPPVQPSNFHATIRCDVRSILQSEFFYQHSSLLMDGSTVRSAICNSQ